MGIDIKEVTYLRKSFSGEIVKEIDFEAYFHNPDIKLQNMQLQKNIPLTQFPPAGIDKISLCLHLNFVNEDCYLIKKLKNGCISTRRHGKYFIFDIHREYIDINKNILDQVKNVIKYLMDSNIFKIPIKKTIKLISTDSQEIKSFNIDIRNEYDFFNTIFDNISISNIEFCFDYNKPIFNCLNNNDFININDSTYYSKDYKYYKSGNKKKSFLCIYDKTKQMREVKNVILKNNITRFELKLFKNHCQQLKSLSILNCTYIVLLLKLKPVIVKKLKKLNINFKNLYENLSDTDLLKDIIYNGLPLIWQILY